MAARDPNTARLHIRCTSQHLAMLHEILDRRGLSSYAEWLRRMIEDDHRRLVRTTRRIERRTER